MNAQDTKYTRFALCQEMFQTIGVIRNIPTHLNSPGLSQLLHPKKIFITGEGSSRIMPANNLIYINNINGSPISIVSEGATQALEYNLTEYLVIGISNSGKTKELIRLFNALTEQQHGSLLSIVANYHTPLELFSKTTIHLKCGQEFAVAATKSVVEQSLVLEQIYHHILGTETNNYKELANLFELSLTIKIDDEIIRSLANAEMIYYVGRNDGVAEELALKTNEIIRKKSDFLEGTYCVHGIEEVMNQGEVVILINPFESEEEKYYEVLVNGVGIQVIAIGPRKTCFPTILVTENQAFMPYLLLAAGWNLLVETGISLGIDLDKPTRARKIGNEYQFES